MPKEHSMRLPCTRRSLGTLAALSLGVLSLFSLSTPAAAKGSYLVTWNSRYPTSQTDDNVINGTGTSCQLCHSSPGGGDGFNAYGWKMRELMGSMSLSAAIQACEPFDSDLDPTGSDNLTEINADTQPGWTSGPNNTYYFKNGSTQSGNNPPALILGQLDPPACTVTTYCTASTTSIPGCSAAISASGTPSVSSPGGFQISSGSVPGGNVGLMYFSDKGKAAIPFGTQGGFVCLKPGFRSKPKTSGGTKNVCNGNYAFTLADLASSSVGIVFAGNTLNAAVWFRDPQSPDTFGLSDAVEFVLCP
jgi:hypothetical protein